MRQNPHVRICGGPGSATTLVYPTPYGVDQLAFRQLDNTGRGYGRLIDRSLASHGTSRLSPVHFGTGERARRLRVAGSSTRSPVVYFT